MMGFPSKHDDSLPLTGELRVDAICQRFEGACRAGQTPSIDDFLGEAKGDERATLLKELIRLDVVYRRQRGEVVLSTEYLSRFPELDAAWLVKEIPASTPADAAPVPVFGGTEPQAGPSEAALANGVPPVQVPGYDILGELGRGGMAVVYRGRDPDLGRDLAVKVIREALQDQPSAIRRFVAEGQVGGQLHHPGCAPVYEAGRLPDNRPYFTMKLVEGQTLSALLKERNTPAQDLPRFLQIFEQVCQALAYAHSKGVIHRDFKPSNAMVGAFGELQLMDWSLAKVVRGRGVRTILSEAAGGRSEAGSVMGTPAYMAPEQARGDADNLDERADVFGLGAILCEILTGSPPYRGKDVDELQSKAKRADLAEAFERLDACCADGDLVRLAKACLSAKPAVRPRDGAAVAATMTAYLAGVQERLRKAELERAAAEARAEEAQAKIQAERRARRMTVALAATVLLAVTGAGAGALWYQHDQSLRAAEKTRLAAEHNRKAANTEHDVTGALEEATAFAKQATGLHDDPVKWEAALAEAQAAAKRADEVINNGVDDSGDLRGRVDALGAELAVADRDRRMIARLQDARLQEAVGAGISTDKVPAVIADAPLIQRSFLWTLYGDRTGAAKLYAAAFEADGMDLATTAPEQIAERINARAIREDLLAELANWRLITPNKDEAKKIFIAMQAADPDPNSLQNCWNAAVVLKDLATLRRLARDALIQNQPPSRMVRFSRGLIDAGDTAEALRFLKEANDRCPGDFWITFGLAYAAAHATPPALDDALRYYTAAAALRPTSPIIRNNIGLTLYGKHQLDEAMFEFKKALDLQPNLAVAHSNLGLVLRDKHQLDQALTEFRTALEEQPALAIAYNNLGVIFLDRRKPGEAADQFRKCIELQADFAEAHSNLGEALRRQGKLDDAITECKAALAFNPDLAMAHANLGVALGDKGQMDEDNGLLDEAEAEERRAIQLQPNLAEAHSSLGELLRAKGHLDDAITEGQSALALSPDLAMAHMNLGCGLAEKGRVEEGITELHRAIDLDPDLTLAHFNLGFVLEGKGQPDEAVAEYSKAIKLKPDLVSAHVNLGAALAAKGQLDDAIVEYRKAIDLQPTHADAHIDLGNALADKGRLGEAIVELRKAVELEPTNATAHYNIGIILLIKVEGRLDEALTELRKAVDLKPDLADAHVMLGNALMRKWSRNDAIAEYRKAIDLKPDDFSGYFNLGIALKVVPGRTQEAAAAFRKAAERKPDYADAYYYLGKMLHYLHETDSADAFQKAIDLKPDYEEAYECRAVALREQGRFSESLTEWHRWQQLRAKTALFDLLAPGRVRSAERLVTLDRMLPAFLKDEAAPVDAEACFGTAEVCRCKGLYGAAARFAENAFLQQPGMENDFPDDYEETLRYHAVRAAALAGCGMGRDAAYLDDKERSRWRQQALRWLWDDLDLWKKNLDSGTPEEHSRAASMVVCCKEDSDLAGVRGDSALAKLPAEEREGWRRLWAEVAALVEKAQVK